MKKTISVSMQTKLLILYFCIGLLPIIVLCFYFSGSVQRVSVSQADEIYSHSADQLSNNLMEKITEIARASFHTGNSDAVVNYLSDTNAKTDYQWFDNHISKVQVHFQQLQYRFENLRFHIYTPNTNIKYSGVFLRNKKEFRRLALALQDTTELFTWSGIRKEYGKSYLIAYAPIKNYFNENATVGILEIGIPLTDLYPYMEEAASSAVVILVLDENNQVLLSTLHNDEKEQEVLQILGTSENESNTVNWNDDDCLVFQSEITSEYLGIHQWKTVHLVPLQAAERGTEQMRTNGFWITGALALVAMVVLILFARNLTTRLRLLTETMNQIEDGHSEVTVPITGNDEIRELGVRFDKMIHRLNFLMNEIYEAEIKKQRMENAQKTAQLIALQNQINPHYLFNTMETIRMNLLIHGDQEIAHVIQMFADGFRRMMDDTVQTCRLQEEIAFVQEYFQVQKYRYEEKIDMMQSVESAVFDAEIPKFLLQPLVENAIYHGLERKVGNGRILIHIERRNEMLWICVEDDGVGMEKEELQQLRSSIANPENGGQKYYALRNIARRLVLLYESKATMEIESTENWGTRICVQIPYQEMKNTEETECIG